MPFAAGGPTDKSARDFAEVLRKPLNNQTVVVENVGGAGGTLGANKVAKAAPDGHTLLLHHIGMATAPALYRNLPYETLDDFEYLGMINDVPMTLIGRSTLPANNFTELRKWMADNKGKINLANAGLGAASHLCGLLFQQAIEIDMTTVPYKGTAPAMTDLLGGQVDLMCDQTTNTSGQIEAGKVKAYAVTTAKRLTTPALRNLPTLDESGLKGFNVVDLARPVRAQGHAQAGAGPAQRGAAPGPEGPGIHQAPGSAGRRGRHRQSAEPGRPQEVRRGRDRQVGRRPSRQRANTPTEDVKTCLRTSSRLRRGASSASTRPAWPTEDAKTCLRTSSRLTPGSRGVRPLQAVRLSAPSAESSPARR